MPNRETTRRIAGLIWHPLPDSLRKGHTFLLRILIMAMKK